LRKKNNLFPFIFQKKFSFLFNILAEWENFFLKEKKKIKKPIFISGLPRSGTTLVTSLINQHTEIGSYNYKDLPFHRIPLIWNKLSNFYYGKVKDEKRLHGDELSVGLNSPDAFEELIWSRNLENYHNFGFSKYLDESYSNLNLENDLIKNIQKILFLRSSDRYLSKGNYNIFRIKYINKIFSDSKFIICFRNPSDTAQSLANVHEKFKNLDFNMKNFSQNLYELCHFEFGNKRKALFFNKKNYDEVINLWREKKEFDGYLLQWIELYNFILDNYVNAQNLKVYLLNFDKLINNHENEIKKVLNFCELDTSKEKFNNLISLKKTSNYNYNIKGNYKDKSNSIFEKLVAFEN